MKEGIEMKEGADMTAGRRRPRRPGAEGHRDHPGAGA